MTRVRLIWKCRQERIARAVVGSALFACYLVWLVSR